MTASVLVLFTPRTPEHTFLFWVCNQTRMAVFPTLSLSGTLSILDLDQQVITHHRLVVFPDMLWGVIFTRHPLGVLVIQADSGV
jgi:hypothetical protein